MSSWFGNFDPSEALKKVKDISSQVQDAIPIDDELIKKLTLRSDDLQAEHDLIDAQETRKELVRDYLASILPWETKDEARVILVDECEESMKSMTANGETFTGPFELPEGIEQMFVSDSEMTEATDDSRAEAAKKLEKMGTLPELLGEGFDLDPHVGLIERLFKVDENLVRAHSLLESAGKTEHIFWKNYFFHCAYIRYTAGLSVEEIWSVQSKPITTDVAAESVSAAASLHEIEDENSVELTFEANEPDIKSVASSVHDVGDADAHGEIVNSSPENSEYEIVDGEGMGEEELDELDAEIARELAEIDDL